MTPAAESPLSDPELHEELRKHAWSRLRPDRLDHVDDVVQECLGRGVAKWHTFDPSRATVAGWMHGFLANVLKETVHKLGKQPAAAADPNAWEDTRRLLDASSDREVLAVLLGKLSPRRREIVTLHHLEGWSHQRIAAKLQMSPGATRVELSRAMAELKMHAAREGLR